MRGAWFKWRESFEWAEWWLGGWRGICGGGVGRLPVGDVRREELGRGERLVWFGGWGGGGCWRIG